MAIAFVRNSGTKAGKATTGGEIEVTVTKGAVGNRWILAISYAHAHVGVSISDAAGDSWKEDAWEENAGLTVSLFSAEILSASTTALKIKGLTSEIATEVSVAEFSGIQKSGSYVRLTGGTKGEGTESSSGSTSGNAKKSDLVFAVQASATNSTFTALGGYTATTTAAQAGGTVAGLWLLSPPETTEPKGKFSVSGKWAGELGVYKSAVVSESLQALLTPNVGGFLLGSEKLSEFTGTETSSVGEIEVFAYKAAQSGTVTSLAVLSDSVANTGVTSLTLGIYADNAGKPGAILGEGTFTGVPPINSWITVTGLSIPVVAGQQYWLAEFPLGGNFHFVKGGVEATGQYYAHSGVTEAKLPTFNESTWSTELYGRGVFRTTGAALTSRKVKHSIQPTLVPLGPDAYGSAPIRDNFNRPNGGTGTNWKIPPGYNEAVIENEQIRVHEGETAAAEAWVAETYGNNQEAYVTRTVLGEEDVVSICMSYLPESEGGTQNNNEWYYVSANKTQVELVYLEKGHVFHSMGTEPVAWKAGDVLGFRREGNKLIVWRGTEGKIIPIGAPVEDTRITTGGFAGIYMLGETARMDNFGAGNVTAMPKNLLGKALFNTVQFGGSVKSRSTTKELFNVVSFSGHVTRNTLHSLAAKASFSGLVNRKTTRPLSGKVEFAGSLPRRTKKALQAAFQSAGALTKAFQIRKTFTPTLNMSGSVTKVFAITKALAASLPFSGAVSKRFAFVKPLLASLTPSGLLSRGLVVRRFSAALGTAGSLARGLIVHRLAAQLAPQGSLHRRFFVKLLASLSFTGNTPRQFSIRKPFTASVSFGGKLQRNISHFVFNRLTFSGTLPRSIRHKLAATFSFDGDVSEKAIQTFKAALGFVTRLRIRRPIADLPIYPEVEVGRAELEVSPAQELQAVISAGTLSAVVETAEKVPVTVTTDEEVI